MTGSGYDPITLTAELKVCPVRTKPLWRSSGATAATTLLYESPIDHPRHQQGFSIYDVTTSIYDVTTEAVLASAQQFPRGGGFVVFKIVQWAKSNDYDKDKSGL